MVAYLIEPDSSTFEFWDTLYISRMAKTTNLKFGMLIDNNEYYSKMQN